MSTEPGACEPHEWSSDSQEAFYGRGTYCVKCNKPKAEVDSDRIAALQARVEELEKAVAVKVEETMYLDETPAVEAQTEWAHSLLDKTAPPYIRHIPHVGEGHTTLVYQHCKLVGVSIIVRDDFNRTSLTCFDIRAALAGKGKSR